LKRVFSMLEVWRQGYPRHAEKLFSASHLRHSGCCGAGNALC
jgi:hypothetical protein